MRCEAHQGCLAFRDIESVAPRWDQYYADCGICDCLLFWIFVTPCQEGPRPARTASHLIDATHYICSATIPEQLSGLHGWPCAEPPLIFALRAERERYFSLLHYTRSKAHADWTIHPFRPCSYPRYVRCVGVPFGLHHQGGVLLHQCHTFGR